MHFRDALIEYAGRHEEHCTRFARAVLTWIERTDLCEETGPTKAKFIEFLETRLVDRNFAELFY